MLGNQEYFLCWERRRLDIIWRVGDKKGTLFMKDLTKGSIIRLILAFALPVFIGNILQLTYNLVDTKIVSQVLGEQSLAAVGSTNSLPAKSV